jgi:SIS domain
MNSVGFKKRRRLNGVRAVSSIRLIGGQATTLEMGLRDIAKEDTAVVVSFFPYSEEAVSTANAARAGGCKLVAITDSDVSPVALPADASIIIGVESPSFFPSTVAAIATIESLIALLVSRGGDTAVKRIERTENPMFATIARPAARNFRYDMTAETTIRAFAGLGTGKAQRYFASDFDRLRLCDATADAV